MEQLHALVRSGRQVILVTSGAVCVGRQVLRQQHVLNSSPLQMMGDHNVCGDPLTSAILCSPLELHPPMVSSGWTVPWYAGTNHSETGTQFVTRRMYVFGATLFAVAELLYISCIISEQ